MIKGSIGIHPHPIPLPSRERENRFLSPLAGERQSEGENLNRENATVLTTYQHGL